MARRRLHSLDDLLDVAERLVTSGGPSGLTLRALAVESGASNGTIYHAFRSKDDLLAQVWLRASNRLGGLMFDALMLADPDTRSPSDMVVAVALAPLEFGRRYPLSARVFFAQRRDQLFTEDVSPEVEGDLAAVQERFVGLMMDLADKMWGRKDRHAVEAVSVCLVDLPTGLLRRGLLAGEAVSEVTAARLEAAVRAVLTLPLESARMRDGEGAA